MGTIPCIDDYILANIQSIDKEHKPAKAKVASLVFSMGGAHLDHMAWMEG